ncbi:MAG: nucleotide sugar dehydrogenase [Planctomycetota bacterium]
MTDALRARIDDREARVGILGLGYVGLPLAMEFIRAGYSVLGFDVAADKVEGLNAGRSHVGDVDDSAVSSAVKDGKFEATTDFARLGEADAVSICVPTPLSKTRDPDMSFVEAATRAVKENIKTGQLIILESTTYPGTTEEVVLPLLQAGGLEAGSDFYLAFSPERVDPGNETYGVRNTPKVLGGVTPACTEMATALYAGAVDTVIPVSSASAAEMVKLLENTFRSVNIALVNEVAIMCDRLGLNVWEVIDAAATKPFGYMPFRPGPGLGGHCIPIDPLYLSWKLRSLNYRARFIELADAVNAEMPDHVVHKVADALNEQSKSVRGSRILLLGLAYKKDIDDLRESPALEILTLLMDRGADVRTVDPHISSFRLGDKVIEPVEMSSDEVKAADAVVITTDHSAFDYEAIVRDAGVIIDTRNATKGVLQRSNVVPL